MCHRSANILTASCLVLGLAAAPMLRAEESGNLRYSISVTKFDNEAGWHGRWDLGDGFQTIMTHALHESGHFIVLGDSEMRQAAMGEQDLAASGRTAGGKKAAATGRMTPAQLLVRGSITHVEDAKAGGGGGIGFRGIRIGGSGGKAEINVTVYLVDSETGQVKASTDVVGTSGKRGVSIGYSGSGLGGLTGDMEGFTKDNMGKATEDAVSQGVAFLVKQLEGIPWEGTVVSASAEKIIINRGTREGLDVGRKLEVGSVEDIVDPDTGEVLDSEMSVVAELEVTSVKEKIAYCKALSGGDAVKKGMTVFAAK